MLDPKSYPHPVDVITTIETHISIVFLTGQYAYKLKKPVDFGFLDFSNLDKRKRFCELEVSLNQRTAPNLYLGVFGVVKKDSEMSIEAFTNAKSPEPQVIDYLVKMKQFNPNHVLGRMLQQSTLSNEMLEQLTSQITNFHQKAEMASMDEEFGQPKVQLQPMLDNFPTLFTHFESNDYSQQLNQLHNWTNQQYQKLTPLLINRKEQGFVRACHGDLHLDNIAIIDQQPVLFDGIEFNDYFRWIDVISDLAFLLIDLDFRNQTAASNKILSLYLSKTLDFNALKLLNFYRVYRTLVRAKISTLRAIQLPENSIEKINTLKTTQKYITQANGYTQPNKQPKMILMQGVSGSGKSYFANQMLDELNDFNAISLSSDRIRKSLFGINSHTRLSDIEKQQLYSKEMSYKTYSALAEYSLTCLNLGFNVIIDATFLRREQREKFRDIAQDTQSKFHVISIQINQELAEHTLTQRTQLNIDPSDADIEVMRNQQKFMQKPDKQESALLLTAEQIRQVFPKQLLQEYLDLPIT